MSDLFEIKGVGNVIVNKLAKLGVFSIRDLVYHFPRTFIDRRKQLKISDLYLIDNENYFCLAEIKKINQIRIRSGKFIVTGVVEDETAKMNVVWFNNPYIVNNFKVGQKVLISGITKDKKLINPKVRKCNSQNDIKEFCKIEPIYPETKGLKSSLISKLVKQVFDEKLFIEEENLPKEIILAENLLDINSALKIMHNPENEIDLKKAQERLAFDEIYNILLEVKKRKQDLEKFKSFPFKIYTEDHDRLIKKISFSLTDSQISAINEIYQDMQKEEPMHRLLNGDVGSGKTIVAAFAAMQTILNERQVVLLAPTSILAMQHYQFFKNLFGEVDTSIHLITANTKDQTNKLKNQLDNSNNNAIFIGTHALLFNMEVFQNIGLLIIDEQHKFGVKQREVLEYFQMNTSHKKLPHVLHMSATPIPRTLALTLYGDLDVSILHKPLIRKNIITKCIYGEDMQNKMYEWIRNQIKTKRHQVYVVCPLIEESEKLDTKSAIKEFENLKKIFPEFNLQILHGKIKSELKDQIINDFKNGKIDILVATSVVEVGIDNPNAVIMIIEGAERFGLAQLHQIRGRVGRSDIQSYCFLKTTNNIKIPRLEFFEKNNDGFAIAEYDLQNRGPGEVYGTAQSGIPKLKVANILDIEFIKRVKKYLL